MIAHVLEELISMKSNPKIIRQISSFMHPKLNIQSYFRLSRAAKIMHIMFLKFSLHSGTKLIMPTHHTSRCSGTRPVFTTRVNLQANLRIAILHCTAHHTAPWPTQQLPAM